MWICRTKLLTLFEKTRTFTDFMIRKTHRAPNGIRSGGERNLIGRRTESDRAADAVRPQNTNIHRHNEAIIKMLKRWKYIVYWQDAFLMFLTMMMKS